MAQSDVGANTRRRGWFGGRTWGAALMSVSTVLVAVNARLLGLKKGQGGQGSATATILFVPCASARLIIEVE